MGWHWVWFLQRLGPTWLQYKAIIHNTV
jgi:hypothetical protein